jgi:toxin ParE1/3/4
MREILHPLVYSDIAEAMEFYEEQGGTKLAAEFFQEIERVIAAIRQRPLSFPRYQNDLRRVRLDRFPFHLLFRIDPSCFYVLVLRHDRRSPDFGLHR